VRRRLLLPLLVLLPVLVYSRSLRYPLLDFDDPVYVTQSPILRAPGLAGLALAWRRPYFHDYIPLTHTSLWLDSRLAGLHPLVFRLDSLAWHLLASFLVFLAARRWTEDETLAGLVALLFSIHPLAVESVAWVASRKNVIALPLFLSAYLAWTTGQQEGRRVAGRLAAIGLFVMSLLAKSASLGFPLVVFGDSLLLGGRRLRVALLEALPYALLAGGYLFFAIRLRHDLPETPLAGPFGIAAIDLQALALYLLNTIVPLRLSAFYTLDLDGFRAIASWAAMAALLAGLAGPFLWIRRKKRAGFLLLWVLAGLLPSLNLVPQPHPIADRFFYWSLPALLGFIVVAASEGLSALSQKIGGRGPDGTPSRIASGRVGPLAGSAAVAAFAALACLRVGFWSSSQRLFEDAVRKSPGSSVAHMHLGNVLSNSPLESDKQRAAAEFETMLACPDAARALRPVARDGAAVFLARMEFARGLRSEADERIARQFSGREGNPDVALLLAQYELATDRPESVIRRLEPGILALPGIPQLGRMLMQAPEMPYRYGPGALSRASDVYLALQQREGLARALSLLGKAYLQAGRADEAATSLSIVCALSHPGAELLRDLASAYEAAGYSERAQACLRDAQALASPKGPS